MLYEIVNVDVIFWVFLLHFSFLYFLGVFNKIIIPLTLVGWRWIGFLSSHVNFEISYRNFFEIISCCFTRKKPV